MPTQLEKAETFRALHEGEPFLFPNPWDAGSARVLEGLGFKALATTSGGFAFTLGRLDGDVTLDEVAQHTRALDQASALPVAVDLENGYGPAPEDAAQAITRAAEAGAIGGSIEDWDPETGIYELSHAVERVAAAAEAARALDFPFTFTARAENQLPAQSPTSTTPSPGCRPTRPPARTWSTRPAWPAATRSARCPTRRRSPRTCWRTPG